MKPFAVVLADDHSLFRHGIKRIIEESDDMAVVGEAEDGLHLLRLLNQVTPDLIILDISMPNLRGIEAIHEIKASHPEIKILVLTMHKEIEYLYSALEAGADGYLLKEGTDAELIVALQRLSSGGAYLSPNLMEIISNDLIDICRRRDNAAGESLSTREREVLKLLAEGKSNKEIAELLFISTKTVEHHRASIMKKLDLKDITQLVKYAIRKGYTSDVF